MPREQYVIAAESSDGRVYYGGSGRTYDPRLATKFPSLQDAIAMHERLVREKAFLRRDTDSEFRVLRMDDDG